jgi:hypothetical protein
VSPLKVFFALLLAHTWSIASLRRRGWRAQCPIACRMVCQASALACPRLTPSTSSLHTPSTPVAAHASAPSRRARPSTRTRPRRQTSNGGPASLVSKWSLRYSHPQRTQSPPAPAPANHIIQPPGARRRRKTFSQGRRSYPCAMPSRRSAV